MRQQACVMIGKRDMGQSAQYQEQPAQEPEEVACKQQQHLHAG
jgi:hypothetical protein